MFVYLGNINKVSFRFFREFHFERKSLGGYIISEVCYSAVDEFVCADRYSYLVGYFESAVFTDILDTAPYDKLSSGTMWTTESSVDQGVIGVYYSLQRPFPSSGFIGVSTWIGYYGWDAMGMCGQGEYGMQNLFTKSVNPSNNASRNNHCSSKLNITPIS